MYQSHVPVLAAAMRACPDTFANGIMFAIVSARTQFVTVPSQMEELKRLGAKASCLWSWKLGTYQYVQTNKVELHRSICAEMDAERALQILCRVPGLGIVKAAFVLQMLGHDVACLDARNIAREGRNPRAFRSDGEKGKSAPAFTRKIARYVSETSGRANELWDVWCSDVAETYRKSAHEISEMHLCFVPRNLRRSVAPMSVPIANQIPF